jgi:hypothetical protein
MKILKIISIIGILAVALLVAPLSAMATTTYYLVVPDTNGFATNLTKTPPPYGTVTVTLDSTQKDATIDFKVWPTTYVPYDGKTYTDYYSFAKTSMLGVNINGGNSDGSNISYSSLAASNEGGALSPQPVITRVSGSSNVDGFGKMNLVFDGPSDVNKSADIDEVVFHVTITTSGWGGWADDAHVLTLNNKDYLTAAHMVADTAGSPGFPPGGVAFTGYAGNGALHTPIPGSVLLLGSGLVALGLLRFRQREKKS